MARSEVADRPVIGNWQALIDYLSADMAHLTVERVRVLYLDSRNRLVQDHHVGDGSVDEAAIHPREVIRRGLDLGATALILVHNHPSGSPEPSRADIALTRDIALAEMAGARIHFRQVTTRAGLDIVRRAKARGVSVTCGVTPAHFMLSDLATVDFRTFARLSPPLRSLLLPRTPAPPTASGVGGGAENQLTRTRE